LATFPRYDERVGQRRKAVAYVRMFSCVITLLKKLEKLNNNKLLTLNASGTTQVEVGCKLFKRLRFSRVTARIIARWSSMECPF
jgi:hypothetical protein